MSAEGDTDQGAGTEPDGKLAKHALFAGVVFAPAVIAGYLRLRRRG